jgi:translation initiation factor 3 subunit C
VRLAGLSPKPYPVLCLSSATQIELLQLLVQIAAENNLGVGVIVKIKFNIIASLYDYNPNLATYMKVRTAEEYWG